MANQDMHSQNKSRTEAKLHSLYELLIYDNQKLASKTEGPHVILRRSPKGKSEGNTTKQPSNHIDLEKAEVAPLQTEATIVETSSNNQRVSVQSEEDKSSKEGSEQIESQSVELEQDTSMVASEGEFVEANTISNYLASLSNHVESDVLRVVDAIIELEKAVEPERQRDESEGQAGTNLLANMEEEVEKRWGDDKIEEYEKEHERDEVTSHSLGQIEKTEGNSEVAGSKKKGIDISDIFKSLKNARKKAEQKNYSYTKKVEYEDH